MIISTEKKFIFVAVPKTGSTSIEKMLERYSDEELEEGKTKHVAFRDIKDIESYHKFCFFRNPWDRIVSLYHYQLRNDGIFLSRRVRDVSFDEWLKKCVQQSIGAVFRRQTDYILERGKLIPNISIYKFEEIDDSWKHICKTLDLEWSPLPHTNKSKHKHYSEYYNDETRHLVEIYDHGAIRMMGYEFEEI